MSTPGNRIRFAPILTWLLFSTLVYCAGVVPVSLVPHFIEFVATTVLLYLCLASSFPWATPFLYSLSIGCFFLILGDGLLRVMLGDSLFYRPHEKLFEKSPVYPSSYRYQPLRKVSQTAIGDLANFTCGQSIVEPRTVRFYTDEHGFRNDPHPLDTDFELIVLGDSFGVATGTSQEKTWWHLLAKRMKKDLYNLSLPSAPRQEVAVLKRELPRLKLAARPVVIWQLFEGNDLLDSPPPDAPLSKHTVQGALLTRLMNYQRRSPINLLVSSVSTGCIHANKVKKVEVSLSGPMLFYLEYQSIHALTQKEIEMVSGWRFLQDSFGTMEELQKQFGFEVLVVLVPTKQHVYLSDAPPGELSPLTRMIMSESKKHKFHFLPARPAFKEVAKKDAVPIYWRDDTHLNDAGNALLAQLVQGQLSEMQTIYVETADVKE